MENIDQLPEVYHGPEGPIREPTYRLLAPCFFDDTYWLDGEILVTEITPNHHMEPLNRAAGERLAAWLASLPGDSANLRHDDLVEASYMLRPREGVPEMDHAAFSAAVIKLANELKARRDGRGAPVIPGSLGVRTAHPGAAPPMANALIDNARGPQFGHQARTVAHQPQPPRPRQARSAKPAMGNVPRESQQQPEG